MALKISEIPTTLSTITNETLVEVSEKVGTSYTTKKYDLKNLTVSPLHGDEAHTEDYVVGPANSIDGGIAVFDGTDGKVVKDAGFPPVKGPDSSIDGGVAVFDGTSGKVLKDFGYIPRKPLETNLIVTVGSTGDYNTINAALEDIVALYYPKYIANGNCPRVTINLLTGFVMAEQVLVESLDLSWITITGADAETVINRSALTTEFVSGYPAFAAINGGFMPIIGQLFNMNTSGDGSNRHGIIVHSNSRAVILQGCGVKNAGSYGIYASSSSMINANSADASGAGSICIQAYGGSIVNADNANASGANLIGIQASRGSLINAKGANASSAGTTGLYVYLGSFINAKDATGTLGQAANTITSNGIIFQ